MRTVENTIIKKYWEAGDLIKIGGYVVEVVSMEGCEVEIKDIPTQDEINNYRLEKCKKDYPIGTRVKSAFIRNKEFLVETAPRILLPSNNICTGEVTLFQFSANKYSEIVSETKEDKSIENLLDEHLAIFREGFLTELKK